MIMSTGAHSFIGENDVKSTRVYFYVQKNSAFSTKGAAIPFEIAVLNIGNAIDIQTGVFTAPVSGRYFFSFSSYTYEQPNNYVQLKLNGVMVGSTANEQTHSMNSIQVILDLKKGDLITLMLLWGQIYDDGHHYNHFTGILLDQDIFN